MSKDSSEIKLFTLNNESLSDFPFSVYYVRKILKGLASILLKRDKYGWGVKKNLLRWGMNAECAYA